MRLADRLVSAMLGVRGVQEAPSQFNAVPALWIDGREFANLHPGVAHIRLTRKAISAARADLKADERVTLRSTDWIAVRLRTAGDLERALELARATPTDRELARRRRTHRAATRDLAP